MRLPFCEYVFVNLVHLWVQTVKKDTLDVYIEHRLLLEQRLHQHDDVTRDPRNKYPAELLRR